MAALRFLFTCQAPFCDRLGPPLKQDRRSQSFEPVICKDKRGPSLHTTACQAHQWNRQAIPVKLRDLRNDQKQFENTFYTMKKRNNNPYL